MSVLIVGAQSRAALSIVQSLGRKKIVVDVADWNPKALAFASRYVRHKRLCPSPYVSKEKFIEKISSLVKTSSYDLVVPSVDETFIPLSEAREEFLPYSMMVLPSREAVEIVFDKLKTAKFSEKQGMKVPKTFGLYEEVDVKKICSEIGFPLVMKARSSVLWSGEKGIRFNTEYAFSLSDLQSILKDREHFREYHLIQEYVEGKTVGFSALAQKGQTLLRFQYERVRDSNPTGSGSSLRRSMPIDTNLKKNVERIIQRLEWSGLIMFEFRVSSKGEFYLIEINGRPWGAIQLAVYSGVDFPFWLYRSIKEDIKPPQTYQTPLLCRWLVGDLWHLYYVMSGPPSGWKLPYPKRFKTALNFLRPNHEEIRYDHICLDDPWPFFRELSAWIGIMLKKVYSRFMLYLKNLIERFDQFNKEKR